MPNLGVSGLSSGINSSEIIDALINASRGSVRVLEKRKTVFSAKLDAVRSLNTKLLIAQTDVGELRRPSTFTGRTATSSNAAVVTATASNSAVPGTYAITVTDVAKANQVATVGKTSSSSFLGTGSVTVQVGSGAAKTFSVTAGNSSLDGLAAAINQASAGVTASVINDGTGAPFRLVVLSNQTGQANAISLTATDDNAGDGADLTNIFSGMSTLTAAADAQVKIGSGAGAITLTKPSNTVTDIIPGVTLNLLAGSTSAVTVTVGADTEAAKKAITTAVTSINTALSYLKENTGYDAETKQGGVLISDTGLRTGMNRLISYLTAGISGQPSGYGSLAAMGITIDKSTGQLAINESMLDERLATNQQAVANAFANTGTSTGSGITFSALSQATKEKAYAVNITAAASQARVASVGDISVDGLGHAVITSANKTISLGVNGSLVTATLAEGSYTRAELVTQVQTAINAVIPASGSKVEARLNGNALDLHSLGYGSRQSLQVLGGSANSILNVSTAVALGADVQGTIDGQAATGLAQSLTGALGSDAEGLRLAITSTVPTSSTVTVRKGLAQRSNEALLAMTSADNGTLVNKTDELESTIEVLTKKITSADANLAVRRKRYEAQFLAMEKAISGLKNQESQLNGQIKGFENAALARSR